LLRKRGNNEPLRISIDEIAISIVPAVRRNPGARRRGDRMNRRGFMALVGSSAVAWPPTAGAQQQSTLPRIAYLSLGPGPTPRLDGLVQGLHELGYAENVNIIIEYRWSDGHLDKAKEQADELATSKVAVIVTGGPTATLIARKATATIPIVMANDHNAIGSGFVSTLARPGSNITGVSSFGTELSSKRLQLLRETVREITNVAILWNPAEPSAEIYVQATREAASALGMQFQSLQIDASSDLESILRIAMTRGGANGLIVQTDYVSLYHRFELADLAAKYRLPTIYTERLYAEAGGFMSYGPDDREMHRLSARYVDKILKGAKPVDLPVEQPTQFVLVINMKTANALGLTIPLSILARADEVIE
jgi:putative ABC transport system substrate-binding protein